MAIILDMPLEEDLSLTTGTGPATFTRSTTATYVDKDDGLVKTAAINTARFETNGVLIEGASTNLLTRSEEFDNAAWTKSSLTVTANNDTAPDGATSMDLLVSAANGSPKFIFQNSSITSGTTYTQSMYAKSGGYDFLQIAGSNSFDNTAFVNFDLSNGTIGNRLNDEGASITDMGGGIYRCSMTLTGNATASGRMLIAIIDTDINSRLPGFTGDGVSGVNLWGAQLEALSFASSYIPTTTTTVTRTTDNLTIPSSNIPAPTLDYSVATDVDVLGDNTSNDEQEIYRVDGESFRFARIALGLSVTEVRHGASFFSSGPAYTSGIQQSIVHAVDVSDAVTGQKLYVGGSLSASGAVTAVGGAKFAISIGKGGTAEYLFGHIKNLKIYDVAIVLTSIPIIMNSYRHRRI